MQEALKSAKTTSTYAIARDFCRIFAEEMNDLYVLSLLLTANTEKAEQVLLAALDDCYKATGVFKDWARNWARRAIVLNAIRSVEPSKHAPAATAFSPVEMAGAPDNTPLPAILRLGAFERFVFVLCLLEKYSEHEVKTLLDRTRHDVILARNRALKHIGKWGQERIAHPTLPMAAMFAQAS